MGIAAYRDAVRTPRAVTASLARGPLHCWFPDDLSGSLRPPECTTVRRGATRSGSHHHEAGSRHLALLVFGHAASIGRRHVRAALSEGARVFIKIALGLPTLSNRLRKTGPELADRVTPRKVTFFMSQRCPVGLHCRAPDLS